MLTIRPLASNFADLCQRASGHAPYLKRLIDRDLPRLGIETCDQLAGAFTPWLAQWTETVAVCKDKDALMAALRRGKREGHLILALQDLAGLAGVPDITARLSDMADTATEAAIAFAATSRGLQTDGLAILALGKHGARELNYSSDIDLVAIYDPKRFDGGERDPADAASRIIRDMIALLETQTADGYVFRTDFRLRPDPSSTPVAVSAVMADAYYESVGQNWERMVYIKGRPCAGDKEAGAHFLRELDPFVWRRHLDYWAIADIHAIKRMINAKVGDPDLGDVATDLKLGPGGIREIEFFAQTQQVILGGRDPTLRDPTTCGALVRLADAGVVSWPVTRELTAAYEALRTVEHRLQMLNDEQTHSLPRSERARDHVAALCGYDNRLRFETDLIAVRETVHVHYQDLFAEEERRTSAANRGNLVFTGVDTDPATVATLRAMGFSDPQRVITTVQTWHRGRVPATRAHRGRQLLTALLPDLLEKMGETGEADTAFTRFTTFFEGLRSGVQVLSMLLAEPDVLEDLVTTLALSPKLALTLSRNPTCLDVLVDGGQGGRLAIAADVDFEAAMDEARRYHREASLLIGHRLLHGWLPAVEAGNLWSDLADETLQAMADAAERECARRLGLPPGRWHVFALGKLGGRELTAGSDLDLLVLYTAEAGASDPQTWFTRFTQRLIAALSAPTGEGTLYEIDMRLRPSGGAGPVAVSLPAFKRYQVEEAWTWEHMALTRLRPVAGDPALAAEAMRHAVSAITARAGREEILSDVANMRERMRTEKPAAGAWDLKLAPGGLVDIEFITQAALLTGGNETLITGNTAEALARLSNAGAFDDADAKALSDALLFQQALQQVMRVALGDAAVGGQFSTGLQGRLARAVGADTFDDVETRLAGHQNAVAALFRKKLPQPATE